MLSALVPALKVLVSPFPHLVLRPVWKLISRTVHVFVDSYTLIPSSDVFGVVDIVWLELHPVDHHKVHISRARTVAGALTVVHRPKFLDEMTNFIPSIFILDVSSQLIGLFFLPRLMVEAGNRFQMIRPFFHWLIDIIG